MNAKENRDELIKEFVTKIEGEPQLWQKCWQGKSDMAKSGATGKYYNGLNSILLTFTQSIQGYDDNRWYTFLEAKKQNASIKKGEKGSPAFFYKEYDKKTKSDFTNETVKDMTREERIKYMQENVVPVLNRFIVFNACQIDGIEKEEHKALMTEEQQRANTIMQAEHIIPASESITCLGRCFGCSYCCAEVCGDSLNFAAAVSIEGDGVLVYSPVSSIFSIVY